MNKKKSSKERRKKARRKEDRDHKIRVLHTVKHIARAVDALLEELGIDKMELT